MLWLSAFAEIIPVEPDKVMLDRGMSLFGVSPLYAYLRKGAFNFSHMQGEKVLQPVTIKRSKQMKDFNELLKVGKAAFDTMYKGVGMLAVWFSIAIVVALATSVAVVTLKNRDKFSVAMRFSLGVILGVIVVIAAFAIFLPLAKSNAYKEAVIILDEDGFDTGAYTKLKNQYKLLIAAMQEFSLIVCAVFAVALAIAFLIFFALKSKKDLMKECKQTEIGAIVGFSISLIAIILFFQLKRLKYKGEIDGAFWLFVGFFVTLLLLVAVGAILKKYAPKAYKYFVYIAFAVIVIYAVALVLSIRYTKSYGENKVEPLHKTAYYIISAVLVVAIIALSFIFGKDEGTASTSKNLAYAGVCIALSFALSYVKFFSLPMGGSITLASMLPLMLYSYMFGARKGVFAGLIYGILQFIQNPQVYEWMQILLDYPIAFSAIGLAGIAKNFKFLKGNMFAEIIVGMAIACLFRYISHVVSGYFVFGVWGNDWKMDPIAYSFAYNSFVFVDLAIDIVAGVLILSTKSMRNVISNVNPKPVTLENNVEA